MMFWPFKKKEEIETVKRLEPEVYIERNKGKPWLVINGLEISNIVYIEILEEHLPFLYNLKEEDIRVRE